MKNIEKFINEPLYLNFDIVRKARYDKCYKYRKYPTQDPMLIVKEIDDYFQTHSTNENEKFYNNLKKKINNKLNDMRLQEIKKQEASPDTYVNLSFEPISPKNCLISFSKWVKETFENLGPNMVDLVKSRTEQTEQTEPLDIQKASHKVLILHELGVLDHLKQKYAVLTIDSDTNMSKLLAPLLNENTETIRAALKNINTNTTRTIINKKSVRKVKAELNKLRIETKTLPDL